MFKALVRAGNQLSRYLLERNPIDDKLPQMLSS